MVNTLAAYSMTYWDKFIPPFYLHIPTFQNIQVYNKNIFNIVSHVVIYKHCLYVNEYLAWIYRLTDSVTVLHASLYNLLKRACIIVEKKQLESESS